VCLRERVLHVRVLHVRVLHVRVLHEAGGRRSVQNVRSSRLLSSRLVTRMGWARSHLPHNLCLHGLEEMVWREGALVLVADVDA